MRLNVEIKKEVYDEFMQYCTVDGRSISDVVRALVIKWNHKKRRECLDALQEAERVRNQDGR